MAAAHYFQRQGRVGGLAGPPLLCRPDRRCDGSASSIRMADAMVSVAAGLLNFVILRDRRSKLSTIVRFKNRPGQLLDERRAADEADLAARARQLRAISRRSDLAGAAIDVDGALLFQRPD